VAITSFFTVAVIVLIALFDLKSASDPVHARIPYIYLGYILLGLGWYALRRKKATVVAN
jgi:cytochrome b